MSDDQPIEEAQVATEREQTQKLLDRIGVFDVSHSTESELLAVIRTLCEAMIDHGLGEDL